MKNRYFILTGVLLTIGGATYAQQGFIAAGGDVSGSSGSVNYSIGQPVFQIVGGTSGLIIEGLQQPDIEGDPLPLTLLYFKAIANKNRTVTLQWTTISEINTDYFTVERSQDAIHFSRLNDVDAKGNSNTKEDYSTLDTHPYVGVSYYRLKETDQDGKVTYSTIQKIYFDSVMSSIVAVPNPADDYLQILIRGVETEGLRYRLMDAVGRQVQEGVLTGGTTNIDISNLTAASYILQVMESRQLLSSFKIIKQ